MLDFDLLLNILSKNPNITLSGLGTFSLEMLDAKLHPVQHQLSPPHRQLHFKFQPDSVDASAIDILADDYGISREAATQKIRDFVNSFLTEVKTKGQVIIPQVGQFIWKEAMLYFEQIEPSLINAANFGLTEFKVSYISRKASPQVADKKKRKLLPWLMWGIFLLLLGSGGFAAYYYDWFAVFTSPPPSLPSPPLVKTIEPKTAKDSLTHDSLISLPPEKPEKDSLQPQAPPIRYYVIFGCFKDEANAKKAIKQLQSEGYPQASLCGKNENGYFKVSYAAFNNKADAEWELSVIQRHGKNEAWISKE